MSVEVIVSVRVLVEIICRLVGPPLEVSQGPLLELLLRYSTFEFGITCGGAVMLNISVSCFRVSVCLSPNVVSRILGVGLRRTLVSSEAAFVDASFDEILGNVRVAGGNPWCWRLSL